MQSRSSMLSKSENLRLYAEAACKNANPILFDQVEHNGLADEALKLCESCPVSIQCFAIVDPHNSYFDGVCAGLVWRNGRSIVAPSIHPTKPDDKHDYIAIDRLIRGEIKWQEVSLVDRRKAALMMYENGAMQQTILDITHFGHISLKKLIKRAGK